MDCLRLPFIRLVNQSFASEPSQVPFYGTFHCNSLSCSEAAKNSRAENLTAETRRARRKDAGEGFLLSALRVSAVKWAARKESPPAKELRPLRISDGGFPAPTGCALRVSAVPLRSPPLNRYGLGTAEDRGLSGHCRTEQRKDRGSAIPKGLCPPAQGCRVREATLG